MNLPFGIQQSTLAGGLAGLAAWGAGIGLTALGITVPPATVSGIIAILIPIVVHFVPDAANVDAEIKTIAGELPQTYQEYPGDPLPNITSNINHG
jgi:hypothetical protein